MDAQYGLIGRKLGHSFSERFFTEKFRDERIGASYRNFELATIGELPAMLAANPGLQGFNVTIPYKEEIIPFLEDMSGEALSIGAVNCVKIKDGKLYGHNTDACGFRNSLLDLIGAMRPEAIILGTGGAAKAVEYALGTLGIEYISVSRSGKNEALTYGELSADPEIIASHKLIINTTPLGMYPAVDTAPEIPYDTLTPEHYLFDLVYNPAQTLFMKKGSARGARAINGYDMLVGQAERSWEIWSLP